MQVVILLFGATNSGKSTLLRLLKQLLPPQAWCSVPPSDWDREYSRMSLVGKRLNVAGDLADDNLIQSAPFKTITGLDPFSARHPYGRVVTVEANTAAHWFAANNFPPIRERDDAFFRRWEILHLPNTKPEDGRVQNLEQTIIEKELPGIAYKVMQAAVRLKKFGPTKSEEDVKLKNQWQLESDSARSFLADPDAIRVTNDSADFIRRSFLYNHYVEWCRKNNRRSLQKLKAYAVFSDVLPHGTDGGGNLGFRGLRHVAHI